MTESQIDYLWELASRDGEQDDLQAQFPDVDWAAAEARQVARWEEARARRTPSAEPAITAAQINDVLRSVFTPERIDELFKESYLFGKLR